MTIYITVGSVHQVVDLARGLFLVLPTITGLSGELSLIYCFSSFINFTRLIQTI